MGCSQSLILATNKKLFEQEVYSTKIRSRNLATHKTILSLKEKGKEEKKEAAFTLNSR